MANSTREQWLLAASHGINHTIFPKGSKCPTIWIESASPCSYQSVLGCCWPTIGKIRINPNIINPIRALDVLVHEMCHATVESLAEVPLKYFLSSGYNGHGVAFASLARTVGLAGPIVNTHAGEPLFIKLSKLNKDLRSLGYGYF